MQVVPELLPPSHFTLAPPASFQKSAPRVDEPRSDVGLTTLTTTENSRNWHARIEKAAGVSTHASGRQVERTVTTPVPKQSARGRRQRVVNACAEATEELRRFSLRSRDASDGDGEDGNWLPSQRREANLRQRNETSTASHRQSQQTPNRSSSPLALRSAASKCWKVGFSGKRYDTSHAQVEAERSTGDNVEEALARTLARCQKIDKSLEFYTDIRKKWEEGSHALTPTHTTNRSTSRSRTEGKTHAHACANLNQATPTQSIRVAAVEGGSRGKQVAPKQPSVATRPVRGAYYHQKLSSNSGGKSRSLARHLPSRDSSDPTKPVLNDLSSVQTNRKEASGHIQSLTQNLHRLESGAPLNRAPKSTASKTKVERPPADVVTVAQPVARQTDTTPLEKPSQWSTASKSKANYSKNDTTSAAPSEKPESKGQEEEEEFNDFDSVAQDSDSEYIEPLSGTFGKPVLTGARPLTASSPCTQRPAEVLLLAGHEYTAQNSLESESVVRRKPVLTTTRSDTEIARVLQAEEESRAGTTLKPNTSNDLAIARQIQRDLNRRDPQATTTTDTQRSVATAAEGRDPPTTMRSNYSYRGNIERAYFLGEEDKYTYEHGYELGREYGVNSHNSLELEQNERSRNIPRKSIRKNNYKGFWDDEYRYREFDERGYRNLGQERFQPGERKTWSREGGTGIITGCVRDLTRSTAILEREAQDLAFEGRQEQEEIPTGLDSQCIQRISHEYLYKENHRPKHESVKPVTRCLVCLDDFHVGEPLRLMPCAHTFHRFCIDKWLDENSNCPVCKEDMVTLARRMGVTVDPDKYKKRYFW